MDLADHEAKRFNHTYVGTEHVLLGILNHKNNAACGVISTIVDIDILRSEVYSQITEGPLQVTMGKLPHTPRVRKAIDIARKKAIDNQLNSICLLLGLVIEKEGTAGQLLLKHGLCEELLMSYLTRTYPEKYAKSIEDSKQDIVAKEIELAVYFAAASKKRNVVMALAELGLRLGVYSLDKCKELISMASQD